MLRAVFAASILAGVSPAAFAQTPTSAPLIVTGSPLAGDHADAAVDTIGRDAILRSGGANLADALQTTPGVAGTSFAAGASRPVIRGMDAQRVKLLESGISSFDVSDVGPDHGVPIDPLSAQRIEVVRGPSVLRYGSQAIGGVVNAVNNRVPLALPDKTLIGEISGAYGSAAESGQGSALLDAGWNRFAVHADGFYRDAGDYDIPGGAQSNSYFRGGGAAAGTSYFFGPADKSHVGAALTHYDAQYGIPAEDTYIDMRQTKALSKSSFAIGAGPLQTVSTDIGYADYQHEEIDPAGAIALSTFKNKEWDGRVEALFGPIGPLSSSALGVQVQNRRYSALGEGADFLSPALTQSEALFGFAEAPLGARTHVQGGLRVEHARVKGTPVTDVATVRDFTPVSGSLGVFYEANEALRFGLTLASAARAPAQVELFARGPHDGPATFEVGDPALKIERSNSLEALVRVRAKGVEFDGSVWAARFDNYIFGALTGRTCDEDGLCAPDDSLDLKEVFYAQEDADFWGAEAKASFDLLSLAGGQLGATLLADVVEARLDGGGEIPRIQPWRAGGGLNWESERGDVGFLVLHVGARDDVAAFETPTEGYTDVQAHIAWRPAEKLEFVLVGRNLADETQRNAVAFNKDEVVMPGRDIRLVARARF